MPASKILVVEDDLIVAQSIKNHLKSLNYDVPATVTTGQEAINKAGEISPDLVLMNIKLSGNMDGVEVATQIHTTYNIPIVYLTAYVDEETLNRAKASEPFGYIVKPFGVNELHSTIEMALYKYKIETRVDHLNRVLRAIRNVNQLITREKNRDKLLQNICDCLVETRGYRSAWIVCLNQTGDILAAAQAGFTQKIDVFIEQLKQGQYPKCWHETLDQPGVLAVDDPVTHCAGCFQEKIHQQWGRMAIRLEHNQKIYGRMVVSVPQNLTADEEERALFQEVAQDIALALHTIEEEELRGEAEAALGQSENRYKQLLESVTDYIHTVTVENGQPIKTIHGPGCEAVTGYTSAEYAANPYLWYDMVCPKDQAAVSQQAAQLINNKTATPLEHRIRHKDGSIRWVRNTPVPHYNKQGELISYDGLISDVTERKLAETEAQKHQEQLQSIFRAAPIGIGMVIDRTLFFVNEKMIEMLGYSKKELIGQNSRMIYPSQEEYEKVGRIKYEQIGKTGVGSVETIFKTKNGKLIDVLLSSSPINPNDLSMGVTFTAMDITERKQVETALRQQRDRVQQYLDIAEVILVVLNKQGEITLLNRKGHKILDYEEGELAGKNWFDMVLLDQEKETVKQVFNQLMAGEMEAVEYYENHVITQTGQERIIAWHNTILKDEAGHITGTLSSGEDITQRKQAEAEKEKLQAQLLQSQKMEAIGRLTGGIAHDFNNLLTAMNGFTELAQQRLPPDSPVQDMLKYILDSGQRAANLVRQLLAFSSKQIIEPKILNLNLLVANLDKMLQRIIGEYIQVNTKLEPNLWPVKVDPTQMEQVIINLVVNARDAMSQGGTLTITTDNVILDNTLENNSDAAPGEYVRLTITDTGTGMNQETQKNIFEPFFTTKEQGKGTGLGLATVYGIIKQNKGDITVDSREGQGTTFKVYLPHIKGETSDTIPSNIKTPVGDETILLVEDDAEVRELICQVLTGQGYTILETKNGTEALELITHNAQPIHLLITDVVMPDMNGKVLAVQITQHFPHLKIIFISGYPNETIASHGILDEGIIFLQKPFTATTLIDKVRTTLDTTPPEGTNHD